VLVAAERGIRHLDSVIADDDDVAIAAITAAEFLVGVELAGARQRPARAAYVEDLLSSTTIESYDLSVARHHAALLAHVQRAGHRRGAHDLIIAATAKARGRSVVTKDPRGFRELPDLDLVLVLVK
jgi:tRNA(fMet)-specific endonuclease VapC